MECTVRTERVRNVLNNVQKQHCDLPYDVILCSVIAAERFSAACWVGELVGLGLQTKNRFELETCPKRAQTREAKCGT